MPIEPIRNFSIIAHIDHGKSTLADRLIQITKAIPERLMQDQVLDTMDLERERGITIKSQAIALSYRSRSGQEFVLNLIDTPGHADFTYEVSRALTSCEGVLLLVDACQGVQAQTISNLYLALEHDLEIIPVINKVDKPTANIERTREQILTELGLDPDAALLASGKTGQGVEDILEAIVQRIPPPQGDRAAPLTALIFDSKYNAYRGAVIYCRVFDGEVRAGDTIKLFYSTNTYRVEEVGVFKIDLIKRESLGAGEVGYIIAGIKSVSETRVGDTITLAERPAPKPLPGYREVLPVVFSSIYPTNTAEYDLLVDSLAKLQLNDASLQYQKDTSSSLGSGFRCGFLGLLHLEIVQERLEREFKLDLITTAPSVKYRVHLKGGKVLEIDNPLNYPDPSKIEKTEEPYIRAQILVPEKYLGGIITHCLEHRGLNQKMNYSSPKRVELYYDLPLAEILFEFYDQLKSLSQGYATFSYEPIGYQESSLVKVDVLVNGERVDALSFIAHRDRAESKARGICERLKKTIPRQQFQIPIQGAIGSRIIARETISAYRKDVTAKCYGGDITRKRKLLERQKEGKKRMKMVGSVEIPQEAFLSVLRTSPVKE
ncbi:MAG: elongation factor 4 [Planctomycetes bacterium]|nr:elongation factor 4 [Planctomycetota bacterium]